ncbi:MAG: thioredoxin [Methanosphaera stadtmanae]|jgi:small redox-active disulfide protein 1|nr:thioredoxin [Methanosphaera stadtmanae]
MSIKLEVFTSKTCPHCPSAVTVAQKVKEQLGDELDFQHLDVDENIDKVRQYQLMSVPTIVIDGKIAFIGAPSEEELLQSIKKRQLLNSQ